MSPVDIRFDEQGLVPVVVQEATTGAVLLVAYMNAEALAATLRTGRAHFWSRSRGRLWRKGERSGREQIVAGLYVNCEQNSLLLRVQQQGGAACHTGYPTCYYRQLAPDGAWQVVEERVFDHAEVYGHSPAGE
jgi:phosphoribosyl-AMP cyclohydrolase